MYFIRFLSPIKRPLACKIFSVNYSMHHPSRFLEVQDGWRERDGVSKRFQLIYKAPMEKLLNFATAYLTFSTATIGSLGAYYAAFVFDRTTMDAPVVLGEDIVIANSGLECFSYLGAFVAFHVVVKVLLSKYVIRLYKDGDNYVAVFRGHWYNSILKHEFHLKDVQKLQPTLVITWGDARFSVGGKHAVLLSDYFKTPEYYNNLVYKKSSKESSNDD
ncbi:hypothetical protein O0L34_g12655 [Tuta absoluta]|nr:hypothetical protein O0L34_g12655 [Tuta absoluta]